MEIINKYINNYNYIIVYQKQGNNKNGNPIYIINFFKKLDNRYINCNCLFKEKKDKYNNIKVISFNIIDTIETILKQLNT